MTGLATAQSQGSLPDRIPVLRSADCYSPLAAAIAGTFRIRAGGTR
jgi:hypothetical protein